MRVHLQKEKLLESFVVNEGTIDSDTNGRLQCEIDMISEDEFRIKAGEKSYHGYYAFDEKKNELFVFSDGFNTRIRLMAEKQVADKSGGNKIVTSTLPGKIIKLLVEAQQEVQEGEVLMVQEAMKMEHSLVAGISGKVSQLYVKEGDVVSADQLLVEIE